MLTSTTEVRDAVCSRNTTHHWYTKSSQCWAFTSKNWEGFRLWSQEYNQITAFNASLADNLLTVHSPYARSVNMVFTKHTDRLT